MTREKGKLYQDPIYGAKVLSPLAVAIIDTPEFQRLAGLRQLGFSDLVYRGAVHTRFQHSVGTYFVCRTLLRRIVQNHERLDLEHPGSYISDKFRYVPDKSGLPPKFTTFQAKWRGLSEVVSAAALLHDLGHVPFGHTLEDELTGIYPHHDSLAGSRLYEMLFDESSDLAKVFSDTHPAWLEALKNEEIRELIYLILNWKEDIDGHCGFEGVLDKALQTAQGSAANRLGALMSSHQQLSGDKLFLPFMSDVVGNTICSDLLDYLPRDRQHLGMEPRLHTRLQRYLTIRPGTLYPDEGIRLSIMVTRKAHGGQRRDVATAVLDIMRERYEMAERVYYHHKKAAASAMLAKLVELVGTEKPNGDEGIYPAPWTVGATGKSSVRHMAHMSDQDLIDYLGTTPISSLNNLQKKIHVALRYRRTDLYRTLLVVDNSLIDASTHAISFVADELRDGGPGHGRSLLESDLEKAADAEPGSILIYCPSPKMQSKVVDARLEISENKVLPLRLQTESFAYRADLEVLQQYYNELWRAYVFVSAEVFADKKKCKAVIDEFCKHFDIPIEVAHRKVRSHDFAASQSSRVGRGFEILHAFVHDLPIADVPKATLAEFLHLTAVDSKFSEILATGGEPAQRLTALFHVAALSVILGAPKREKQKVYKKAEIEGFENYRKSILGGGSPHRVAARDGQEDYDSFVQNLISAILADMPGTNTPG